MSAVDQPGDLASGHSGARGHSGGHSGSVGGAMPPAAAAAESGATWCRRAARAVRQRVADAGQLVREYQYVVALDDGIRHGTRDATRADAAARNRYTNVLPYDYNRVRLPRLSNSGSSGSTYINASRIALPPAAPSAPAGYIATQGPLPNTAEHFWAMAVDAAAPAVVMLTNCVEKGAVKCARYFPDAPGDTAAFGGVTLTVEARERFSGDCDRRTLRVEFGGGGGGGARARQQHRLQHFHYHAWPDHGVPSDSTTLRALCREVQRLAPASGARGGAAGPTAVMDGGSGGAATPVLHCSAGIGRTGTFIAVDALLRRIDAWFRPGGPTKGEVEAALDVPLLVHSLRQQRGGMVQTLEQYAFVYRAALDELDARAAPAPGSGGGGGGG